MSAEDRPALGFVGAGKAGSALSVAFSTAGYPVTAVYSRTSEHAEAVSRRTGATVCAAPVDAAHLSEMLFLAVPDDAIADLTSQIAEAGGFDSGSGVVHISGVLPLDALQEAGARGALTGVFHPLQALAGIPSAMLLKGAFIGVEAGPELLPVLRIMAEDLQASPLELDSASRVPYHIAAVLAANYPLALLVAAEDLMRTAGVPDELALTSLLPLAHGSLVNLEWSGVPGGLTGPVVRSDAATVRRHIEYLREHKPRLVDTYRTLALLLLDSLPEVSQRAGVREELEV